MEYPIEDKLNAMHRDIRVILDTTAAERERALRQDNERLRGKCNRLIGLVNDMDREAYDWLVAVDALGLHWDDLDPEPHGATQEIDHE